MAAVLISGMNHQAQVQFMTILSGKIYGLQKSNGRHAVRRYQKIRKNAVKELSLDP